MKLLPSPIAAKQFQPSFPWKRGLLGLAVFSTAWFTLPPGINWILSQALDYDDLRTEIQTEVAKATGLQIASDGLLIEPTLWEGVRVTLLGPVIRDPENRPLARARSIKVYARYWSFITEQVQEIGKVQLDHLTAWLEPDSYLFHLPTPPSEEGGPVRLRDTQILLNHYTLYTLKALEPENRYRISGKIARIKHLESNKPLSAQLHSRVFLSLPGEYLPITEIDARGRVDSALLSATEIDPQWVKGAQIKLSNLALAPLAQVLNTHPEFTTAQGPLQGQGVVSQLNLGFRNRKKQDLPELKLDARLHTPVRLRLAGYRLDLSPGSLQGHTQLLGLLESKPGSLPGLQAMEWNLKTPEMTWKVSGDWLQGETPEATPLNLKVETSSVDLSILHCLPPNTPLGDFVHRLSGQAKARLRLRGTLADPQIRGRVWAEKINLLVNEGIARTATLRDVLPMVNQLSGELQFGKDEIRLKQLQGKLKQAPFSANLVYQEKNETLKGQIQAKALNMGLFLPLLKDLDQALGLQLPSELKTFVLSGETDADVKFNGPLNALQSQGKVEIRKVSLHTRTNRKTPILEPVDAQILFEGQQIRLPRMDLTVAQNALQLEGVLSTSHQTLETTLTGNRLNFSTLHQEAGRISRALGMNLPELDDVAVEGTGDVRLTLGGALSDPSVGGAINLHGVNVHYHPEDLRVENLTGAMNLQGTRLALAPLEGRIENLPFSLEGSLTPTFQDSQITLRANHWDLHAIYSLLLDKFPEYADTLALITDLNGTASVDLTVASGEAGREMTHPRVSGEVHLHQLALRPQEFPYSMTVDHLAFSVAPVQGGHHRVNLPKTTGHFGPVAFTLEGMAGAADGGEETYDIRLTSDPIPLEFIREHQPAVEKMAHLDLPEIWNTAGSLQVAAQVAPGHHDLALTFHDAGLSWQGGDFPLYNLNGTVQVIDALNGNPPSLYSDKLTFRYGNSFVETDLRYDADKTMHFDSRGSLSPLFLTHYMVPRNMIQTLHGTVPYEFRMDGRLPSLKPGGQGNHLDVDLDVVIPHLLSAPKITPVEKELSATAEAPPAPNPKASLPFATLTSRVLLRNDQLQVEHAELNLLNIGNLRVLATLDNLFEPDAWQYAARLLTEPILDFSKLDTQYQGDLFQDASGTVAVDMKVTKLSNAQEPEGLSQAGDAQGFIRVQDLRIPELDLLGFSAHVDFHDTQAEVEIDKLQIPGTDIHFSARTDDLFETPLRLEEVRIWGPQFALTQFNEFMERIVVPKIQNNLLSDVYVPPREWELMYPVEFRDATVQLDEVIYDNIILENVTSRLSLFANGFKELMDLRCQMAGGTLSGTIVMNPRENNFLSLDLKPENVKANALARALLDMPNTIFGDLSGHMRITTHGDTEEAMINNSNGTASFAITNGRLPAVARIETLLTAVNILRGGVVGLNLNNLFRALRPFNTNYFSELSGDVQIASGVMYTDNLLSDGENLDLLISGSIRMIDGDADLKVVGSMSQDVSGILGPLGKLSIGRLVGLIPGLGYLPGQNTRGGILGYLPGIGFVPGFGGPAQDYNRFQVTLKGLLDDPGSVKDLEWIR
jgi:hypothetical protein